MIDEPNINPRKDLPDRVALVTGAASGIGLAITKRFIQEGAKVALWDFNQAKLEESKDSVAILRRKMMSSQRWNRRLLISAS